MTSLTPEPGPIAAWTALPGGLRLFADRLNHRLLIESPSDNISAIGSEGTSAGQFRFPSGLASDGTLLFIADSWNHRVQVWDAGRLEPRFEFGKLGQAPGDLCAPRSLTLMADWVAVADTLNRRISFFDRHGSHEFDQPVRRPPTRIDTRKDGLWVRFDDGTSGWLT